MTASFRTAAGGRIDRERDRTADDGVAKGGSGKRGSVRGGGLIAAGKYRQECELRDANS